MLLPKFEYLTPTSLEEACSLLAKHETQARPLAGGTDLLVKMKERKLSPRYLIGLKNIPNLDYLTLDPDGFVRIGTLTTLNSIYRSALIRRRLPVLSGAAEHMATIQIRNLGTVGGNLCNAVPSADMAPPLIALGSKAIIAGPVGRRAVPLDEFFIGTGMTALKAGELLAEVQAPIETEKWGYAYSKLCLKGRHELAAVSVAAALKLGEGGICEGCRIVLGAVAPTAIRARKTEQAIKGEVLTEALIKKIAPLACQEAAPRPDSQRVSASYRTQMVTVMTRRMLLKALEDCRN